MKNKLLGIVLLPLLYIRWSFIFCLPFPLIMVTISPDIPHDINGLILGGFVCWGIWAILFGFIFGNLEVLIPITDWLIKILKI